MRNQKGSLVNASTQTTWGFGTTIDTSFDTAIERTKAALAAEGFGVLTVIDMRATLQEKVGADVGDYVILGACNPQLAARAVEAEREIGLLLPCNVIVHDDAGTMKVSIMDPAAALGIVENDAIAPVASEARERLLRVIDALQSAEEARS
jgi:uncharacterized protein (DUF302 family)